MNSKVEIRTRHRLGLPLLIICVFLFSACADQPLGVVEVVGTPPPGALSAATPVTDTAAMTATAPTTDTGVATATQGMIGVPNAENVLITASSLLNYNFENVGGEVSGQVQDIVLDVTTGQILFLVISYRGFLDLGVTELPVPLSAFSWGPANELVLTIEEERLENFPQLHENWPDATDQGWDDTLVDFWRALGLETGFAYDAPSHTIVRASEIIGYPVGNVEQPATPAGALATPAVTPVAPVVATAATVEDMLVNLGQGRATYLVLGFTPGGLTDEAIAVPFHAFDPTAFGDQFVFNANIDQETLQAAPRFDRGLYTGPVGATEEDVYELFWRGVVDESAVEPADIGPLDITGAGGVVNAERILIRASTLLDANFQTVDGALGGGIDDILLDAANGQILFVTLEYGGFLGLGTSALPVPLSAFIWDPAGELRLNIEEERLQDFPNVGTDWPDVANPNWDDQVTLFWRERGIDPGFDVTEASNTILRASELLQFPVADMGSGAGTVVDLLIALGENRAKYMILAQGTGTADSPRVAAPFSAFDPMAFGDEFVFDPNLDPAVMRSAPRFDPTLFPGPGHIDSAALDEFDLYWEQQGYPVRVRETQ